MVDTKYILFIIFINTLVNRKRNKTRPIKILRLSKQKHTKTYKRPQNSRGQLKYHSIYNKCLFDISQVIGRLKIM